MKVTEEFIGKLTKTFAGVPTGARSAEEILAHLDRIGIEAYVTKKVDLAVKCWQFIEGFVTEEQAAVIRTSHSPPMEGDRMDWLSENLQFIQQNFAGQWIAVGDNEIIASAPTLPELLNLIADIENPFVTFIPAEPIVWTFAYGDQKF